MFGRRALIVLGVGLLVAWNASPQEPPLPPGLGPSLSAEDKAQEEGPALPPGLGEPGDEAEEVEAVEEEVRHFALPIHGFWEARGGLRTGDDPAQPRDAILGETRVQLETEYAWESAVIDFTGDIILDGAMEEADFDLRSLRLTVTPFENVDIRLGRQILTWGTGDLIFLNDLFPKDFVSFLSGRDVEYLKAPSDAVKVSVFSDLVNVDVAYTPQFDHDRFVTGERISFWNPLLQRSVGRDNEVRYTAPSDEFTDDEIAVRLYKNLGGYEFALYGYDGFWKSPAGQNLALQATFPRLRVFGASARGTVGKGIANLEFAYYDSLDDPDGDNPFVNNSEFRFLVGYEREIGKEFTAAFQYYLEHIFDFDEFNAVPARFRQAREENRHVFTIRLTKLLMNQDLTLSLFAFLSPSDEDAYLRPKISYKVTDAWELTGGANIFVGNEPDTFFGQFENNTNVYASMRYSF